MLQDSSIEDGASNVSTLRRVLGTALHKRGAADLPRLSDESSLPTTQLTHRSAWCE